MKTRSLSLPTLAAIAGTRAMLGAGIGLLASMRLPRRRRRRIGLALLAIGMASTAPIARAVFAQR
jgi:hypothetical protein